MVFRTVLILLTVLKKTSYSDLFLGRGQSQCIDVNYLRVSVGLEVHRSPMDVPLILSV